MATKKDKLPGPTQAPQKGHSAQLLVSLGSRLMLPLELSMTFLKITEIPA